ncbi:hypothetical protein P3G55_16290 [Leptospira sp. 96542]|nr:hypothetical protein [Leptospira sp. 96542]
MKSKLIEFFMKYREIVWPEERINSFDSRLILKNAVRNLLVVSGSYVILYFIVYIFKFSTYMSYNEKVIADLNSKNGNLFQKFLNTYPGNLIYIVLTLIIFAILMTIISYLLSLLLEVDKREFKLHLGLNLRAVTTAFSVFPFVLFFNSLFATGPSVDRFAASILVSSWVILGITSFLISLRCYIRDNEEIFRQPKRRSAIAWGIPFYFVLNFMFGVIFK